MLKGMKKGLVCALLVATLIAPVAYASAPAGEPSPFTSISQLLKSIYSDFQQGLLGAWQATFQHSEDDESDEGVELPEDPSGNSAFTSDPPPPPTPDDDDDGGNFGGGSDPFG